MKVTFLTADDPIYLPAFFARVLAECAAITDSVYAVPPLYKGQSPRAAAWRYYRTFGASAAAGLTKRVFRAKATRSAIGNVCRQYGVSHGVVRDVNAPRLVAEVAERGIDVIVSVSCPQIFKEDLLHTPALGCLNVHGALLPHYRGIMPSFWMLANGEREAGVTVYFMNEEIDGGDIAGQRSFEIMPSETLDEFLVRSKRVAADLLIDVLRDLGQGTVPRRPMNLAEGSYYSWPTARDVERFIAAGHRLW